MQDQKPQDQEAMDILKGTFLAEIITIAKNGKFKELPGLSVVVDGEKVLDEATRIEKACRTYVAIFNEEALKKIETGIPVGDKDVQDILSLVHMAEKLFWTILRKRLGNNSIDLRQGWQVIAVEDEEGRCNCPSCQMRRQGISGGVMAIEISVPSSDSVSLLSRIFGRRG